MNRTLHARTFAALRPLLFPAALLFSFTGFVAAQQVRLPTSKGGIADLSSSGPQRHEGDLYIADGDVDIHYQDSRLRADHVEYNSKTTETIARGHVLYDYENQHLEAAEARYNVSTGRGTFTAVRGTFKIERSPNPAILITDNPLYFEAAEVEHFPGDLYLVRKAWITICDPKHPKWQFYAPRARIRLNKTVALVSANFRLFHVPLIWLPYATTPAGNKVRESGFLIPDIGQSSRKGFIFGDAFYWAPTSWMDATLGGQYLSSRGASVRGDFRAKPIENTSIHYSYYGVEDRGLVAEGIRQPQGGEQQSLEILSLLPGGWRFVTDYNQLSSLTFRLAFSDTFGEAVNSEVRSNIFLTNNFHGFSVNFAGLNDKSFLSLPVAQTPTTPLIPAISVTLRNLPEARFGSVEQSPLKSLPLHFGFDSFIGALHRSDTIIDTPASVSRMEFAPRVTLPVHFGAWLGVTASAAFRSTRYGDSLNSTTGLPDGKSITRNTGEFSFELRPPTFERFFERASPDKSKVRKRFKHTIEPAITYRYVTGVNHFADFIRFDSNSTLSDTNEIEYGLTQRFYVKTADDQPQELVSWSIFQKHYFDPTFGGAIVEGQRNVFQALDSVSPFAFAFGSRNSSPIISDIKITPGGRYDFEQILQYDTQIQRLITVGTLLKVKPFREFFATVAHFRLDDNPVSVNAPFEQPLSNQVRALFGYGSETRKGFNFTGGVGYDFTNHTLQNQIVQASYNGSCCGLALEYRRINLGTVRTENQFRIAFIIANIGNFGNLRHQEKIF